MNEAEKNLEIARIKTYNQEKFTLNSTIIFLDLIILGIAYI
jgi:hypothetical protein